MKRTFAVVALLAALGVLCKLALKEGASPGGERPGPDAALAGPAAPDPEAELLRALPGPEGPRARRRATLRRYRQTALAIERTDGLRGLALLDRLDLEAIYLYEKHPGDFRRLRDTLTDDAAADLLLHWRRVLRPEAGRRHRPGHPDRRDRPAVARPAAGGGAVSPTPCRWSWPTRSA